MTHRRLALCCCLLATVASAVLAAEPDLAAQPAPVLSPPPAEYSGDKRIFQGIPGIERAPKGRLWAVWYGGGPGEGPFNYVMIVTSGDDGKTWSDLKLVIDPPDDVRAFDPCLWLDPTGRLWLCWAQGWSHWDWRGGVWAMTTDEPDAENPKWTEPRRLFNGIMMNKPTVLTTGEWVFPGCVWNREPSKRPAGQTWNFPDERFSTLMLTVDHGKTFSILGRPGVPKRVFDEHMLVERYDGSLWTLVRTGYGIGQSFSTDKGKTWSAGQDSRINSPATRFFIRRLTSGKLLLVHNNPPAGVKGRTHLTAQLSGDDGKTWNAGILIDERRAVSYPDGTQGPDGKIYLIYDHDRTGEKEILMAVLTEADIQAGKIVSSHGRLRVLVNQATGTRAAARARKNSSDLRDNADGAKLLVGPAAVMTGLSAPQLMKATADLFTDRKYKANQLPDALKGVRYVHAALEGSEGECSREGVVYVITPLKDRNRDSIAAALEAAGFERAAVPEFILFGDSAANACTVFQKKLMSGEKLNLPKWGVLLLPGE